MILELDMNVPGGVIVEETSTDIFLVVCRLSCWREKASLCIANKLVNRDLLTRHQVVLFQHSDAISDGG